MNIGNHLGGHNNKTHLDNGSLTWLIEKFNIKSFLDIGCGPGGMVELAASHGLYSLGIDGDFSITRNKSNNFLIHDYTVGPIDLNQKFDLAWSVEFVEHVHEQYIPNFIHSFQLAKFLIITYAPPGWHGHHHVNLREESYWIEKIKSYNFEYDPSLTQELRTVTTMNFPNKPKKAFVKNRGLFFINKEF